MKNKILERILLLFSSSKKEQEKEPVFDSKKGALELELNELKNELIKEKEFNKALIRDSEKAAAAGKDSELERIFANIAVPLSQLLLQESLLRGGKQIANEDIMKIVLSLLNIFKEEDLTVLGVPGDEVKYSVDEMQPLRGDYNPTVNESVLIKIPGFKYKGKIIRKSFIEKRIL